jgi:hypothetical protein
VEQKPLSFISSQHSDVAKPVLSFIQAHKNLQ